MIRHLQKAHILGIDMETSAIFSVGIYRKVKTACIFGGVNKSILVKVYRVLF